jgi:magnesium chelatase subunit I
MKNQLTLKTLGDLKASGYQPKSISNELRNNLIAALEQGVNPFPGVLGYENTVLPEIQRAILSGHNINLLGLRGQAKTRIARQMTALLDEYIPVLEGSDINEDPLQPITGASKALIDIHGDSTPIRWMHREERFVEKLATPDVTVADLIGDIDPIKAANLKVSYSDERAIHFGLIPRANRCIFVINEIPDLQARIQVALFNILQEGDIQIRGFRMRLPLDIRFIFTANPEDYTNRGSIVTPLKDRIQSQIVTHYPKNLQTARNITAQEARLPEAQQKRVFIPELLHDLVEQIGFEARQSEFVDAKSGVSARLSISALENLASTAERRALLNKEAKTVARITDLWGVIPAINGKIELVYEGEQEGPVNVAKFLVTRAIRTQFLNYFPDPDRQKRNREKNPYQTIIDWFNQNKEVDIMVDAKAESYAKSMNKVEGLKELVKFYHKNLSEQDELLLMEFVLYGLAAYSQISRLALDSNVVFRDMLSSVFQGGGNLGEEDEEDDGFNLN